MDRFAALSDHLNTAHDRVTSVVCNWTMALMLHAKSHVKKYFEAMVFKLVGIEISILHLWLLLNESIRCHFKTKTPEGVFINMNIFNWPCAVMWCGGTKSPAEESFYAP